MAEDNTNLEEIMSNWDSMDIGELGTSLLARKATMEKAAAKRAKKQEKREMAMGVLMAGQALFANGANKRIAERTAAGQLDQQNSPEQITDLKITGNIYTILDEMENAWNLENPNSQGFLNADGTLSTQFMSLGGLNNATIEAPTWEAFVDENPQYKNRLEQAIEPQLLVAMKELGLSNLAQDATYPELKDNLTTNLVGNFITNREIFTREARTLLEMGPESDDKQLFKRLGGLNLSRLNQLKIRRMNKDIEAFRRSGNLFNKNGYLSALSRINLAEEPENGIFNAVQDYQDTGIDIPLQALNIKNGVSEYFNAERNAPRMRNYLGRALSDEAKVTRDVISEILTTGLVDMTSNKKINTGIQRRRWQRVSGLNKAIVGAMVPAGMAYRDRNYPSAQGPKTAPELDQPFEKKEYGKRLKGFGKRILGRAAPIITRGAARVGISNPYTAGGALIAAASAPIFMKSHLKILQDELKTDKQVLEAVTTSATGLYLRLKDYKQDPEFNKSFFFDETNPNAKPITDDSTLMNAAISYTLANSVSDIRTMTNFSGDKQTGGLFGASKRGRFFGDVNNFIINTEKVNNLLEKKFSIQDGQFIAERAYTRLKDPLSKVDAIELEFKHIIEQAKKGGLSEDDANILLDRFTYDIDAAAVYNETLDFSTTFTNADIINILKDLDASGYNSVYEFMEDFSETDVDKRRYKRFDDFLPR